MPLLGAGLLTGTAAAQTRPVLPDQPAAPAPAATPPLATPAPTPVEDYRLGHIYRLETSTGSAYVGTLISLSLDALELETKDLGRIMVPRANIRRSTDETTGAGAVAGAVGIAARPGYYDIGNGNRLFFAPTGRGLRRGEGDLQTVNLFLVGANYGITDNISFGGYVSLIPGLALNEQLIVLTPKFSAPIGPKVSVGLGALYLNVPFNGNSSGGAGIVYGALTYGSAADNLTFGLGYGFFQGNVGSTPVLQIGGQKRISRRISLVSENYIIANSKAGMGGLYGVKINWRRTSLGLGAAYLYSFPYTETSTNYNYYTGQTYTETRRIGGQFGSTYILPVYVDFNFRFGKGSK